MNRKYIPISQLEPGSRVESCYLLVNAQSRPKKDGGTFMTMALKDSTGKITGIMWDNFDALASGAIKENDFVDVVGDVLTYNSALQFKISKITKANDAEVDASHFLPVSPVPPAKMDAELAGCIASVGDADLRRLLDSVFGNAEFAAAFKRAPCAVSMHQAYLGGLLEHTLCVTRNALAIATAYPAANRDLLTTGALLHDIGKTQEYAYEKKLAYTDVGRLLGHISIGNAMIEVHCSRLPGFPAEKKVLIQHMILSHHGQLEYGSPKLPSTLEALVLHAADKLDAELSNYLEWAQAPNRQTVRWEHSHMFERQMFGLHRTVEGATLMQMQGYPVLQAAAAHVVEENYEAYAGPDSPEASPGAAAAGAPALAAPASAPGGPVDLGKLSNFGNRLMR